MSQSNVSHPDNIHPQMEAADNTQAQSLIMPEESHRPHHIHQLHEHLILSANSPAAMMEDPASIGNQQTAAYLEFVSMQSAFPQDPFFPFAFPVVYDNIAQVMIDPSYFMHPAAAAATAVANASTYCGLPPHELLASHETASPVSTAGECLHIDQPILFPLLTHQLHYHTPEASATASPPGDSELAVSPMEITNVKMDAPPALAIDAASPPKSPHSPHENFSAPKKLPAKKRQLASRNGASAGPDRKQKPPRFKATEEELKFLMSVFETNPFPNAKMRQFISKKVGMSDKQVVVWFQNKRASCKVNGIVAVKPKKGDMATVVPGNLVQVSTENPFFFTKA
ncbi:hypothetical protein HDU82_001572 [Entophlyctis luteolus]|nr:hypothetical protein HDU82_001572 [Entophlyctis luteolus]